MKFPRIELWKRKPKDDGGARARVTRFLNAYHAVEIQTGIAACAAVQAMTDRRYLSTEAPLGLPIKNCTQADDCACRFKHHADRRTGDRRLVWGTPEARKNGAAVSLLDPSPPRHRRSRGRRQDD